MMVAMTLRKMESVASDISVKVLRSSRLVSLPMTELALEAAKYSTSSLHLRHCSSKAFALLQAKANSSTGLPAAARALFFSRPAFSRARI